MTFFEIASLGASIIAVLGNALIAVIWFNVRKLISDMDGLRDDMDIHRNNLNDHKLFAANNFAKDADFKDMVRDLHSTMNVMQNALNTNTNMTAVVSEKVSALTERINSKT